MITEEPLYKNNNLAKLVSVESINNGHTIYVTISGISVLPETITSSMDAFGLNRRFKFMNYEIDKDNSKRYIILNRSKPKIPLKVQISFKDLSIILNCMKRKIDYVSN
jgi:hypothetical protein